MKLTAVLLVAILCGLSCSKEAKQESASQAPQPKSLAAHETHVLPNVHHLGKLISGGVPDGEAGFDELLAMGVKTVISVDGASPDVTRARARGMRYVHIPITYSEVPEKQRLEIARAIRDLPGPVYIHCHHGKHRSPAATAAAAVTLGLATPDEGIAFMKTAGTAPSYTGLYQCVAEGTAATALAVSSASNTFPEVQKPEGLVAAMIEVDTAYENLANIRAAGWSTPRDHPDLVPVAEAGRLSDQLRFCGEDARAKAHRNDYATKLADAIAKATALEHGIMSGEPRELLERHWKQVSASCKDCHVAYRDTKR